MSLLVSHTPGEHQISDVPTLVRDFRIVAHFGRCRYGRYKIWNLYEGISWWRLCCEVGN